MRSLVCVICVLAFAFPSSGQDNPLLRFIEFRDGSVLRLPIADEAWQITVIRSDGQVEQVTAQLGQIDNLVFTREKGFAKKQALLSAVRRLGADDFQEREQAQGELLKLGSDIRADLENCLSFSTDTEARIRLQGILKALPQATAPRTSAAVFDRFRLGDECWGHLGDSGLPVRIDGKTWRLARTHVAKVSRAPPPYLWISDLRPASSAAFERIAAADFPPGCVSEPFERTPTGRALQIGENIERLFVEKGFVLSTSIASSHVSVNNFKVEGKSGGLSAATNQPLWEGTITVRFVEPGREEAPAGVHYFGCWIAAVVPNGTHLVAFDRHGRELGRVGTQTHGNDFLGVRSATPIYSIRIVPNVAFDRDYTLDDFTFSPPHNPETRHPDKFIVRLKSGGRVLCNDVSFEADGVRIFGPPAELPDWTVPLDDIERIAMPGQMSFNEPAAVFAELRDGSVLAGKADPGNAAPVFPRAANVLQDGKQLAAVWSSSRLPGGKAPMSDKVQIWNSEQNRWQEITGVRFLEEIVLWKKNDEFEAAPYQRLPALRFTPEPLQPVGTWRVITEDRDDLVLQNPQQLRGRLSQGISAAWQDRPVQLMRTEMRFLVQQGR